MWRLYTRHEPKRKDFLIIIIFHLWENFHISQVFIKI